MQDTTLQGGKFVRGVNDYNIRLDMGVHYKIAPENNLWLLFNFDEFNRDELVRESFTNISNGFTDTNIFNDSDEFQINEYSIGIQNIWSLTDRLILTSGLLAVHTNAKETFISESIFPSFRFRDIYDVSVRHTSWEGYANIDINVTDALSLHLGMFLFYADQENYQKIILFFGLFSTEFERNFTEVNPRLGITYAINTGQVLRIAYQRWSRHDVDGSLIPMSSAGIPLETRFNAIHGTNDRIRLQLDWQFTGNLFAQLYAERNYVNNENSLRGVFSLGEVNLDKLKNEINLSTLNEDFLGIIPEINSKSEIESVGVKINYGLFDNLTARIAYNC